MKPLSLFPRINPLLAATLTAIALTASIAAYTALKPQGWLIVEVECDGANLDLWVKEGTIIIYNWTHSVEKTPLVEYYEVTESGLVLVKAEAKSSGAGHPYSAEEIGGRSFTFSNGWMVYDANYTVGGTLEILGEPEYSATLTLVTPAGEARLLCTNFTNARIAVVRP